MNPRIGVTLPQFSSDISLLRSAARRAVDSGLDSLWVFDHMWPLGQRKRSILECWSTLSFLAAATSEIGIGTLVTRSSLRNPAVLARMAATVARIAPGRLTIGIGSGDEESKAENVAAGIPYYSGADRFVQLAETVATLRGHLQGEDLSVPVWVGGRSRGAREVAATHADGWNCWAAAPTEFASEAKQVSEAAGDRRLELTWGGLFVAAQDDSAARAVLGHRDPAPYLVGGPDVVAERLASLAAAGATHIIATFPDAGKPGGYEVLGTVKKRLGWT
ncbi:MAG TPA: LLM class flavin-dependent oxidoreductase [Actinomycetota bacterium]|nr:LLM class flavin-dependent oxidoreductase [Actinomycetota bacterium]